MTSRDATGGRRRLRRPAHWVVVIYVCGLTFTLLGLVMVGDPDQTGSFDWSATSVGVVCIAMGLLVTYALGWVPKVWFGPHELVVRELAGTTVRIATRVVPRTEVASIGLGAGVGGVFDTDFPVLVLRSGEEVELHRHARYVMPWMSDNPRTLRDVARLRAWLSQERDQG